MTRAEMEALARRVETEEPSDELRCSVLRAFDWSDAYIEESDANPLRSRDAAASLMPPNWIVADLCQTVGLWHCSLWREDERMEFGRAPDEPRARTAAAIRAIAQEKADG